MGVRFFEYQAYRDVLLKYLASYNFLEGYFDEKKLDFYYFKHILSLQYIDLRFYFSNWYSYIDWLN
jgi:hypothetical protein